MERNSERAKSMTLENVAQVVLDLRDNLRALTDEVFRLNQEVGKICRSQKTILPLSIHLAIIISSMMVTFVCVVWLITQVGRL
jgi:hypothetical protein